MDLNEVSQIGDLMKVYKPKPIQLISRGQWLNRFHYKLSQDWNGTVPLTRLRVGVAMKKFPDWELPVIWKLCDTSTVSFAKCFWGTAKQRKLPPKEKKLKQKSLDF